MIDPESDESDGDGYTGKISSTRGLLDKASVRPHNKNLPPTQPQRNDHADSPTREQYFAQYGRIPDPRAGIHDNHIGSTRSDV